MTNSQVEQYLLKGLLRKLSQSYFNYHTSDFNGNCSFVYNLMRCYYSNTDTKKTILSIYNFNIFREKYHILIVIVIIKDRQKDNQMIHIQETRMCFVSYSL